MNVKELIAVLTKLPNQDAEVCTFDYGLDNNFKITGVQQYTHQDDAVCIETTAD